MTNEKSDTKERVRCEIYSRVVGYLRPVNQWNEGKQAEYKMRTTYDAVFNKEENSVKLAPLTKTLHSDQIAQKSD